MWRGEKLSDCTTSPEGKYLKKSDSVAVPVAEQSFNTAGQICFTSKMYYSLVYLFLTAVTVLEFTYAKPARNISGFRRGRNPIQEPFHRNQSAYSKEQLHCFNVLKVYVKDTCHDLLERGPCGDGEWLVLDEESIPTIKPVCKRRPCKKDFALWADDGRCHDLNNQAVCTKEGTTLVNDYYGMGSCGCKKGNQKAMHTNGVCYTLYTRGPCNTGQIYVEDKKGIPQCQKDRCARYNVDNKGPTYVYWPETRLCYPLKSKGPCDKDNVLLVVPRKRTVECANDLEFLKIVDVPAECDGTDHKGNCINGIRIETQGEKYLTDLILSSKKRKRGVN